MRHALALALAALLLAAPAADASTLVARDVPWLARHADAVVHADVVGLRQEVDAEGRAWTHTTLAVRDVWSGSAPGELEVTQLGGKYPDGRVTRVEGDLSLRPGQEVVIFLRRAEGRWWSLVLGWSAFQVDRADGSPRLRRDLHGVSLMDWGADGRLAPVEPAELVFPTTLDALRREVTL